MPKITQVASGSLAVHPHSCLRFRGGVLLMLAWLTFNAAQAQTTNYALGTTALLVGPEAGTNSVVLAVVPATAAWSATANAAWLHLGQANQSGTGSTNVVFSYDANPGATRTGTLTIAGQTLTVTQASSTYVAIGNMTAPVPSGLNYPTGVAVDGAGNLYIADSDEFDSAIMEWSQANNTVTALVSATLDGPFAVAVDGVGNVYIADTGNNAIKKWTAANNTVTTLVSSGLGDPHGVAVDVAGNVYIADTGNGAIKEWTKANNTVTTLVSSGLSDPYGLAVDGSGSVYIAERGNEAIEKWTAANNSVTTLLSSALSPPDGVAVDGTGDVYVAGNGAIQELPLAFIDPTDRLESLAGGSDTIIVLPATVNLLAPFTPTSDPSWLAISGVTNGVVSFTFTTTAVNRTGFITLLGQTIPVTQGGPSYSLSATTLLEGPTAGSDAVVLSAYPNNPAWTNTANAAWLHLSPANQTGAGCTNVTFGYDPNPGTTRSGTITIGGQTLTVTQAGSTYVAVGLLPLVSSGLNTPSGVTVDGSGNVYIADTSNNVVKKWTAASSTVTTLVSSGLSNPTGVALDGTGNVYIANYGGTIGKWTAATSKLTTLVSSGLNGPRGVAVDGSGNVYIADTGHDAIKEWRVADSNVVTLVVPLPFSGLKVPYGVAVDGADNVYFTQNYNSYDSGGTVGELIGATDSVNTLATRLYDPTGVALDGNANVYFIESWEGRGFVYEWMVANNSATQLVYWTVVPTAVPYGVAVDATGNIYIADSGNNEIMELPHAFVDPTARLERAGAGIDALPVVLPATAYLAGAFIPTSNQPWLTISGVTNGVVSFSFTANLGSSRTASITLLGQTIPVTQSGPTFSLGSTALVVGPGAGSNSAVLAVVPKSDIWTAATNASWLHLSLANQNGMGSTNVVFTYDANPGATRSGTLTIGGQRLILTQAGSTFVAAGPLSTLVTSGVVQPQGVAVDSTGNVYVADTYNNQIKEWSPANNTVTTLVSSGLGGPKGVAVDNAGNVYIADSGNDAIKVWTVANSNLATLVSGLNGPSGVAVDNAGNVYVADTLNNAIIEWTVANNNITTLVSGLNGPSGVAVDAAGNVYIADTLDGTIEEWTAANSKVTRLLSSGLNGPSGVAVDGSGNVYVADATNNAIMKWTAASNTLTTLVSSGLNAPSGVAVDGSGNVYVADTFNNAIKELPRAFVDATPRSESADAGSDALVVLPDTENRLAAFTPASSDPTWLTISGITNGVVSFSFSANLGSSRSAHLALLGQTIPVTQGGLSYKLGTSALVVGSAAGSNSVVLAVIPTIATWMATTNATWLHLSLGSQSGTGSANVVFSYDANPGATRSGTLTIAGQTLTVTQAGSTYVAASPLTTLVSTGLNLPGSVAVDSAGNVYVADTFNNAIREWTVANNTVTTLVALGLNLPSGVRVDGAGNVYISDYGDNTIYKWTAATSKVAPLLASGLNGPQNVAVDGAGNVYIADGGNNAIKEWTAADSSVRTLVASGLSQPSGVAVDSAGNVYVADTYNNEIKKWTSANNTVTTLVSGLNNPTGVAVDGAGNVDIADYGNNAIKKWTASKNTLTTLLSSGLKHPGDVAVDGAGNIYIADCRNNAIKELPYAFVDPSPRLEGLAAGSDALPVVLPATANLLGPFAPTSDQSWLAIGAIANGVVSFSFTANTGPARTAHVSLLGQTISITQGVVGTRPGLTGLQMPGNGVFQFCFTNTPSASFTVLTTTNLSLPMADWAVVGTPTEIAPGQFQFASQPASNNPARFYAIRTP